VPEIGCMDDKIVFKLETEKPFTGRIYVKGSSDDSNCMMNFLTNDKTSATYTISIGACGMRRARQVFKQFYVIVILFLFNAKYLIVLT
jgi:hypothetical protein